MSKLNQLRREVETMVVERPTNRYIGTSVAPSYVAGRCQDGTEGCLIGQALMRLGWVNPYDPLLTTRDDWGFVSEGGDRKYNGLFPVIELAYHLLLLPTDRILETQEMQDLEFLREIQRKQDTGFLWYSAAGAAEEWADSFC